MDGYIVSMFKVSLCYALLPKDSQITQPCFLYDGWPIPLPTMFFNPLPPPRPFPIQLYLFPLVLLVL